MGSDCTGFCDALKQVSARQANHRLGFIFKPGMRGPWQETAKHFLVFPLVSSKDREWIAVLAFRQMPDGFAICFESKFGNS